MNPDDIFAPQGVAYNPRSTPILSKPAPSPYPGARILYDQTDGLGVTTVIIQKEKQDVDLNLMIPLHVVPHTGLVLQEFGGESILMGSHLRPTMNILAINGCDCSSMSIQEAMLLISSTVGELTLQAVHSQVLLWPNTETGNQQTLEVSTSNTTADTTTNTSPYTEPAAPKLTTATAAAPTTTTTHSKKIKVVIQKSNKRSSVGLSVTNETIHGTHTFPVIDAIESPGLCSNTALQVGMRIWSVNGLVCYTKEDTLTKLKRAKGTCHIEAQMVDLELEANNNNHGTINTARGSSPKRGVARTLSPKNWLPALQKRITTNNSEKAELIPTESGESA